MPYILQTDRLTKIIGEKELVRDVDLHVCLLYTSDAADE